MYKIDIKYEINDNEWDALLEKNSASTFFQTAKYLNSDNEYRYPIFISIKKDNEIKGQLGITIVKNNTGSTKYLRKISQILIYLSF